MYFFIESCLLWSCVLTSFLIRSTQTLSYEGIVAGSISTPKTYTYTVFIKIGSYNICSGAIVGDQFVITAGHCLYDENEGSLVSSRIKVVAGTTDAMDRDDVHRVEIDVTKIYVYKTFREDSMQISRLINSNVKDIAVLKLREPLDIHCNEHVSKLRLPDDSDEPYLDKETLVVSGFGSDGLKNEEDEEDEELKFDGRLRHVEATIVDNQNCSSITIFQWLDNSQEHVCAELKRNHLNRSGSTCSGDSGGPLVIRKDILIGIVSRGSSRCDNPTTVFTKIASHKDFIEKVMNEQLDATIRCKVLMPS